MLRNRFRTVIVRVHPIGLEMPSRFQQAVQIDQTDVMFLRHIHGGLSILRQNRGESALGVVEFPGMARVIGLGHDRRQGRQDGLGAFDSTDKLVYSSLHAFHFKAVTVLGRVLHG